MEKNNGYDLICKHCGLVLHSTRDRDFLMYRHTMIEHPDAWAKILMAENNKEEK